MGEDNTLNNGPQPENIEQVLKERERLDQMLKEKFRKKMAIVFSDVSGFTQYTDTFGDIQRAGPGFKSTTISSFRLSRATAERY